MRDFWNDPDLFLRTDEEDEGYNPNDHDDDDEEPEPDDHVLEDEPPPDVDEELAEFVEGIDRAFV